MCGIRSQRALDGFKGDPGKTVAIKAIKAMSQWQLAICRIRSECGNNGGLQLPEFPGQGGPGHLSSHQLLGSNIRKEQTFTYPACGFPRGSPWSNRVLDTIDLSSALTRLLGSKLLL